MLGVGGCQSPSRSTAGAKVKCKENRESLWNGRRPSKSGAETVRNMVPGPNAEHNDNDKERPRNLIQWPWRGI